MTQTKTADSYIAELLGAPGNLVYTTEGISRVLVPYYETLYSSRRGVDTATLVAYFDSIALLWLGDAHRLYLDIFYNEEDIVEVIQSMPSGKAPGLDGLTV